MGVMSILGKLAEECEEFSIRQDSSSYLQAVTKVGFYEASDYTGEREIRNDAESKAYLEHYFPQTRYGIIIICDVTTYFIRHPTFRP